MAATKISALTAATSVASADVLPIVQSGSNKKAAMSALAAWLQANTGGNMPTRDEGSYVSALKFGAKLNGTDDDTEALQSAFDSGENITCGGKSAKISGSLYMKTDLQSFANARLTISAALGVPAIWLGASSDTGAPTAATIVSPHLSRIHIVGSGTKEAGSAGLVFVNATTALIDSLFAWYLHSGVRVDGTSLVNLLMNADLRSNVIGFNDPSTAPLTADWQGGMVLGGRIEANEQEGVVIGSPNVRFVGAVIEGNGATEVGGDGTHAEVRIPSGTTTIGALTFSDCYMESIPSKTVDCMIEVEGTGTARTVLLNGGEYFAQDAENRYIIRSDSTATVQAYILRNVAVSAFKNYVRANIVSNGYVLIDPAYADEYRNAAADVTVTNPGTGGAQLLQFDRSAGIRTTADIRGNRLQQSAPLEAGYRYGGFELSHRVTGIAASSAEIVPASRIAGDLSYLVEVRGIAKGWSQHSALHMQILINGGGGTTAVVDSGVLYEHEASLTTVGVSVVSNGITLTDLNTDNERTWDFQVTMRAVAGPS